MFIISLMFGFSLLPLILSLTVALINRNKRLSLFDFEIDRLKELKNNVVKNQKFNNNLKQEERINEFRKANKINKMQSENKSKDSLINLEDDPEKILKAVLF